jgi:hypothetical protein
VGRCIEQRSRRGEEGDLFVLPSDLLSLPLSLSLSPSAASACQLRDECALHGSLCVVVLRWRLRRIVKLSVSVVCFLRARTPLHPLRRYRSCSNSSSNNPHEWELLDPPPLLTIASHSRLLPAPLISSNIPPLVALLPVIHPARTCLTFQSMILRMPPLMVTLPLRRLRRVRFVHQR